MYQVRFENVNNNNNSGSYIRLLISVDGSNWGTGGGHVISGNNHSTNYESLSLSNIVKVVANKTIKIQAHNENDTDGWSMMSESYLSIFLVNTF